MPAIFWLQCLSLASSSRAWPAPTMLNLMAAPRFARPPFKESANRPMLDKPHHGCRY